MDFQLSHANVWWLLAGALVALELITGTFYLLMLGLAAAAAALAASAGLGLTEQLVAAAIVGVLGAVLGPGMAAKRRRLQGGSGSSVTQAHAQHLDIGAAVHVSEWDAQGTARVQYRGAHWTAVMAEGQHPTPGSYRVQDVQGNRLVLEKH